MRRVKNIEGQDAIEEQDALQVRPPKRPIGAFIIYYKKQVEMMKAEGIVKISKAVKDEITKKWNNLEEDSKLEYRREGRENSENYANLTHNIPCKPRKVSLDTRCTLGRVRSMVNKLNLRQKSVIQELGFGSLLDLKEINLDRDLCKWLIDHFDQNTCALDICGKRLSISTQDVEYILGIKSNGVDISIVGSAEEINHVCQQYGLNVEGDIPIKLLEDELNKMETSEDKFVSYFLMFVVGTLLCPTTKSYMKRSFILICRNVEEIRNLNWAKFVLDFLIQGVRKHKDKNLVAVDGCVLLLMLFYFEHVNVEIDVEHSKRLQPRICFWGKEEVKQRMLKLHSIGGFDSPKLVVTQKKGGYETANIPLEKQYINQSHAMPCRDEHKPNTDSDEATRRSEQSLTSIRDDMLILHNTVNVIAKNMETFKKDIVLELKNVIANSMETFKNDIFLELKNAAKNTETFKNDICLELKNVAKRERTGHTIDFDLSNIVEGLKNKRKVLPTKESTSPVQDKMDEDDTVHVKKESKKKSTSPVQDKMHQDNTSKPICLELKNVAKRESTGRIIDLDLNDIVEELKNETKVLPKKDSTSPVQDKMDQDDTVRIKKESKKKYTSPIQDNMHQDDTSKPIKREFKTVLPSPIQDTMENDRNAHMVGLSKSIQKPSSKTVLSHNVDVDMLQLTFPHNNRNIASSVTHSAKRKVTNSLKRSPIVTSHVVVPNLKKRKKIKDICQESRLVDEKNINEFPPFTGLEKIICNYIFNKDLDGSELLVNMKFEYGDRAAFFSLLPNQWISSQVKGLDKLLSFLEKDNYTNSITKFPLQSPPLDPIQNNGYDCGMLRSRRLNQRKPQNSLLCCGGYGSYGGSGSPGASYGGPGGLYGSRAGYGGSSRYHPYAR
ncbi:hypothetical protein SO802_007917 [Lithocarpus litseifolius]|uniref:HMG box domain-containing protein n=1 Tax=Lithocarpus litseifolius TaxID=425828 RepID=A0AAW2DRR6_9ROSI